MIKSKYMVDAVVIRNMATSLEYAAHALNGIASYVQHVQDIVDKLEYELELKNKRKATESE